MASTDDLIPLIYHEKQEPGSMLCAQHALNSLLQGSYFTAPDLSAIARQLDEEEARYDEANTGQSTNMDDTGFFSVQVLERALQVWGLTLVRWRSERMRPYHDHPHAQLGFVLNLEQHWYTLRRFGETCPDPDINLHHSVGHWFNLNSSLERPEWISKLYLGMVLQQAEADGYSVFAVVQHDPEAPLAMPLTAADHLAATIPERTASSATRGQPSTSHPSGLEGFEDEDMELQAALQASLMHAAYSYDMPAASSSQAQGSSYASAPSANVLGSLRNFGNTATPRSHTLPPVIPPLFEEPYNDDDDDDDEFVDPDPDPEIAVNTDPVAASMARNRAFLARFQREQEAALRETYGAPDEGAEARAVRRRQQEEEEEMLRRALAESEAMHRDAQAQAQAQQAEDVEMHEAAPVVPPLPAAYDGRVYDDEDAELQAALRASLESVPEGFRMPDTPPNTARPLPSASAPAPMQRQPSIASTQSESESSIATESDSEPQQVEQLSMEEIRRRRLARFGGS